MTVLTKICGLTNLADAQVAVDAGADFLGFNLYAKSSRYIPPAQVAEVLEQLALPAHIQTVGIFVNTPTEGVITILAQTGLHLAQLHGDEPADALVALDGRGFKAVRPADEAAAQHATIYTSYPSDTTPQLLMDAYHPSAYGGTGQQADWALASSVAQEVPRLMLAGGLTAANVARAIAQVKPWAVDVASGVEAAPGRKDHEQMRAFLSNARRA